MTQGQFDVEDMAFSTAFVLSAATSVGLADVSMWGFNWSDVWTSVAGFSVTYATAISLAILSWVYLTNDINLNKMPNSHQYVLGATMLLVVATPTVDSITQAVLASSTLGVGAVLVQTGGYLTLSYMR